jgi:hypothetical protein
MWSPQARQVASQGRSDSRNHATNLDAEHGVAYDLKAAFRAVMDVGKSGDVQAFAACLDLFMAYAEPQSSEPFAVLADTLGRWRTEILNYARSDGASNGFA